MSTDSPAFSIIQQHSDTRVNHTGDAFHFLFRKLEVVLVQYTDGWFDPEILKKTTVSRTSRDAFKPCMSHNFTWNVCLCKLMSSAVLCVFLNVFCSSLLCSVPSVRDSSGLLEILCVCEMMLCCLLRWWCVFSWLLYVDPFHRGSCVLLEEGQTVTTSGGSQQDLKETREPGRTDLCVRSVRTLLKVSGAVCLSVSVSVTVYYCNCRVRNQHNYILTNTSE